MAFNGKTLARPCAHNVIRRKKECFENRLTCSHDCHFRFDLVCLCHVRASCRAMRDGYHRATELFVSLVVLVRRQFTMHATHFAKVPKLFFSLRSIFRLQGYA